MSANWIRGLGMGLLICLVYVRAFTAGYTWDDDVLILNNLLVHRWDGLWYIWFTSLAEDYYPITWTSFWLEWKIWGPNPYGYHAVNVLLHAFNTILVWKVLKALKVPSAWFAALLFGIHPVCVDSVAWISQRKNMLSMLFFMLSILAYLRASSEKWSWQHLWSLAAFLCAVLSKSSVIMLPFVLWIIAWYRRGALRRHDLVVSLPFFATSAFFAGIALWFQGNVIGVSVDRSPTIAESIWGSLFMAFQGEYGLFDRLLISARSLTFYLHTYLTPYKLAMIYPRWESQLTAPFAWVCLVGLAIIPVISYRMRHKFGRGMFAGLGYIAIVLFPVLGMMAMNFHYFSWVSNHLCYLGTPGFCALVAGYGTFALRKFPNGWKPLGFIASACILIVFSQQTYSRCVLYHNPLNTKMGKSLWEDNIEQYPESAPPWNSLGSVLLELNEPEKARQCFDKAVMLRPAFLAAWNNLSVALIKLGRLEEALQTAQKIIATSPNHVAAHQNAGVSLLNLKQPDEAVHYFDEAIQIDPYYHLAHHFKGIALTQQGHWKEAVTSLGKAVQIAPGNADYYAQYALVLLTMGQEQSALQQFLEAIEAGSTDTFVHAQAAWMLATNKNATLRNGKQALEITNIALEQSQISDDRLLRAQAAALAELGRFEEAVASLKGLLAENDTINQAFVDQLKQDIALYSDRKTRGR